MTTLTTEELRRMRSWIGSTPTDEELQTIYDDLESIDDTIMEAMRNKLALMVESPASFSVDGAFSRSNAENIRALRERINDFIIRGGEFGDMTAESESGVTVARITRADAR